MDPWLEHPWLWPEVHTSLIAAIRDELSPRVAPRYYVAIEQRTYRLKHDELVLVGLPDVTVMRGHGEEGRVSESSATTAVVEVSVPGVEEVVERYLEVRDVKSRALVTVVELLSPSNKLHRKGREDYLAKRDEVFSTRTNFVEIDLLRAGRSMPVEGRHHAADYRILVRRGREGSKARLFLFSLRDSIAAFGVPLLPGDL